MVRVPINHALFRALAFLTLAIFAGNCASSSRDAARPDDPNRGLASAAALILPPKTEITFPPLPLKRLAHAIHRGSPVAGYELAFGHGSCRITCIGGDCAITPNSEEQLFLVQGKFVVSYSRMFVSGNRLIAFLASLKRSFEAPIIYLDCHLASPASRALNVDDLLAQLPPDTAIDSQKNAGLTLTESLPDALPVYELATNRCFRKRGNPYPRAGLFALNSKGIVAYDPTGKALEYKIGCGNRGGVSRCSKISEYLQSNGVTGCLF
jgi:hypothetical protein